MTAPVICTGDVAVYVECPGCAGAGEVGTTQDYWGNWDTARCPVCYGQAMITAEYAADYRAHVCIHGEYEDGEHECPRCAWDKQPNPWRDGVVPVDGGWGQPPPF